MSLSDPSILERAGLSEHELDPPFLLCPKSAPVYVIRSNANYNIVLTRTFLLASCRYSRYFGHGYVITEFTKTQATHTFCFVNTILQRDITTDCSKVLKQMSGTNHLIDA